MSHVCRAECVSLAPLISVMTIALSNPVKYLRGVGPHRAALLEERGILTVGDLLAYLPFRYEDRIRFTPIAEIIPGQPHTIFVEVAMPAARCDSPAGAAACFTSPCAMAPARSTHVFFMARISKENSSRANGW